MSDYWKGRRVTVTGGAGFLGRHIVARLKEVGADVFVPRSREYNLLEPDAPRRLLAGAKPQVVIHAAGAVGGIAANRNHPARYFYENAMIGLQVLEACRRADVPKTVVVGTVCSYPKSAPVPIREDDLWIGYPEETNAPYGLAKKMLLVQAQAYRQEHGMNAIYLLLGNLYGPHDNLDPETSHVIPGLIRKCVEAQKSGRDEIEAWGTGKATREFLYVEDAADGIAVAAERYDGADPVNLGSGREISIRDLAALIASLSGFKGRFHWDTRKPDGQPRRHLDTSRAERLFGWRARTTLEEGLRRTIAWYQKSIEH